MNTQDIAISVKNVSKTFKLPHEQSSGLKQVILNVFRKNKRRGYEEQQVLDGISFDIKKGEFFGIVGRNGSGKSTLLKLISQIYVPDGGSIEVNGSLTPFIELGVGFNPELTGRENVYMNGALLGFSNKQMDEMYDEIVKFAELERFMDQKLKNYSSGMQVRLAFSIAIRADTEILVLDEVLAVGDEAFQRKCNEYFKKVKNDKTKTVVLVTHSMDAVRRYCDRAVLIRNGKVIIEGSPEDVANEYSLENLTVATVDNTKDEKDSLIKDLKVDLVSGSQIDQNGPLEIKVSYEVPTKIPTRIKVSLQDVNRGAPIFASDSPVILKDKVEMTLYAKIDSLNDTDMKLQISIRNEAFEILQFLPDSLSPVVSIRRSDYPKVTTKTTWALLFNRGEWRE